MSGMTNMEGSTSSAGPQLVPKDDHGLPAQKERRRFARSAQACHSVSPYWVGPGQATILTTFSAVSKSQAQVWWYTTVPMP